MTPTGLLIGQIAIVFAIVIAGVWSATQLAAAMLGYLKLQPESGEIDFVVAGRRTTDAVQPWAFEGREIDIDTPWETAIKKMFYRPSTFKVRDVFDLAAVVDRHADQLRSHLIVVEDRLDKLILLCDGQQLRCSARVVPPKGRSFAQSS